MKTPRGTFTLVMIVASFLLCKLAANPPEWDPFPNWNLDTLQVVGTLAIVILVLAIMVMIAFALKGKHRD